MKLTLFDYCQQSDRAELLEQWHREKNENLSPSDVLYRSNRKVWWRCERGHEWLAQIASRTEGTGCPVCSNVVVVAGDNDLATTHPEVAAQWHPTKNGELRANQLAPYSNRRVWWLCPKGHEWEAQVFSRSFLGSGCPVCAGKIIVPGENDLASHLPRIAAEWHPTKNGELRPNQVAPFSNRKAWWLCPKGHEYQAAINSRTNRDTGCPVCAGRKILPGFNDLASLHPKIAAQWHPTFNEALTPEMVGPGSHKKVWWQCGDGHVWQAVVYSRTGPGKTGCPFCAGTVSKKKAEYYKKIIAEKKFEMREDDDTWF